MPTAVIRNIDLGSKLPPEKMRCALEVSNPSTVVRLGIRRVMTSCPCLHVLSYPVEIAPGKTGRVLLRVFPEKPGPFQYRVWVVTESEKESILSFRIQGKASKAVPVEEMAELKGIRPELLTIRRSTPTGECFLSVQKALEAYQSKQPVFLVDVRGESAFRAAGIPGAVPLPIYAVHSSALLTGRDVVLIGRGYGEQRLLRECRELRRRKSVASAFILKGGINAWYNTGGPIRGASFACRGLALLSPSEFHRIRGVTGWCFVDISKTHGALSRALLPDGIRSSAATVGKQLDVLFKTAANAEKNVFRALIANESGDYRHLWTLGKGRKGRAVFFLDGGLRAYQKFLQMQSALRTRSVVTTRGLKPCSGCP